jgi:hypothetical protein
VYINDSTTGGCMIKNILLVIFITLSISFAISYCSVLYQLKKVSKDLSKLFIENKIMQEYIDITKSNNVLKKEDEIVHKENFIKFLSDSRDWAYAYIEEVQTGLNVFVDEVDSYISYFDTYSDVLSVERPDYAAMKQISKSYKNLKKLLPVEENK